MSNNGKWFREVTGTEKEKTHRSKRPKPAGKFDALFEAADALEGKKYKKYSSDGDAYYTDEVHQYMHAVYACKDVSPELDLTNYSEILERHGFLDKEGQHFDVDRMDVQCIMAMLIFFNRGEHFGFDLVFQNLKNGVIQRAVARLKELTGYKERRSGGEKNGSGDRKAAVSEKSGEKTRRSKRPKTGGKFDALFEAADALEGDKYFEEGDDGYPYYTDAVNRFFYEVEHFFVNNPDYDPRESRDILDRNGFENAYSFDLSDKDDRCVMALFLSMISHERFNDGLLGTMCKNGIVQKAVARLKELEESKKTGKRVSKGRFRETGADEEKE